jgi:hypothetical protein
MTAQILRRGLSLIRRPSLVKRKAYEFYLDRQFRWPIYDVSRYVRNREPRRLYRRVRAGMAPLRVEQRVIRELKEKGISVVNINDLLPFQMFGKIQDWAEELLRKRTIEERIRAVERGEKPADAKAGKFYIVRPLGDVPVVDMNDGVVSMGLSDPILRIVCGYLGMFARLTAVDLWYNVPTPGPAVSSQRWHRDPEDKRIVKTFLYLRDVDETNGPFCFIPGSHNGGPFKAVYPQTVAGANYPADSAVEQEFSANRRQICTGKAGTLIFCDTTGFHKGGHPTAGARFVFNAVYTSNAAAPLIVRAGQFSLKGWGDGLGPAAAYAIGHLGAMTFRL